MSRLLDTSILVGVIRRDPAVWNWMNRNAARPLSVAAVTVFELTRGVERAEDAKDVEAALSMVSIVAMDGAIAGRAGALLRRFGPSHGLDVGDAMIAATAQVTKLPLVTLNAKRFPMVARLDRP